MVLKKNIKFSKFLSFWFGPIPKIKNSKISEISLFFQILTIAITQDLKTTKMWTERKTERFRYELKAKNENSWDFRVFDFDLYPKSKTRKSREFCLPWIVTLVVTQDSKTPKKWVEIKTKRFRYDLEQKRKLLTFPNFRFRPIPKIENSEI